MQKKHWIIATLTVIIVAVICGSLLFTGSDTKDDKIPDDGKELVIDGVVEQTEQQKETNEESAEDVDGADAKKDVAKNETETEILEEDPATQGNITDNQPKNNEDKDETVDGEESQENTEPIELPFVPYNGK